VRDINTITEAIIGEAIAVHRELGPGLLESTYEACLEARLEACGLHVERQAAMPLVYNGQRIRVAYRVDLLVEDRVIVELKVVAKYEPVHLAQVRTYLRLSTCDVALMINFNLPRLVDGIRRIVRRGDEPSRPSPQSSLPLPVESVQGGAGPAQAG
jgi:GxxExxY protein